jgi:hypothetical protein
MSESIHDIFKQEMESILTEHSNPEHILSGVMVASDRDARMIVIRFGGMPFEFTLTPEKALEFGQAVVSCAKDLIGG